MAQSAGSLGLSTCTPTPSAKQRWSELVLSLSWCQPRVGPGPSYRTWADTVFREESVECPIQGCGCDGRVLGKKPFPYNDTSKKHKEDDKCCYLATGMCEMNSDVLSWRLCFLTTHVPGFCSVSCISKMCQAKEKDMSRIALKTKTAVQMGLFFNSCLT